MTIGDALRVAGPGGWVRREGWTLEIAFVASAPGPLSGDPLGTWYTRDRESGDSAPLSAGAIRAVPRDAVFGPDSLAADDWLVSP